MSVWDELDALRRKHEAQMAELISLAKVGGTYLTPRRLPNGLYVFRTRSGVKPEVTQRFASFDEAKAELERVNNEKKGGGKPR